jgi:molybdopterin-guanine dinucleotide biosynthesis protein A
MGADKLSMELGGRSLLDRVLQVLHPRFEEILVVGRAVDGYRSVPDLFPVKASLVGLHSALVHASYPRVFVCGGDMPYLNGSLIEALGDVAEPVVVPRTDRPHPLHAWYEPSVCLAPVEAACRADKLRLTDLLDSLPVSWVDEPWLCRYDPGLSSLTNVNTWGDLP